MIRIMNIANVRKIFRGRVLGLEKASLFGNESYQKRGDFSTGDSKPRKHLFKVRISEPRARIYRRLPLAVLMGGTRVPSRRTS